MSASLLIPSTVGLSAGTIIGGKYRIDGFLGAGGMGIVLRATHLELNAPVAIKIVRDELAQREEVVSRLLFEARAAAQMRSAHIVRVLDVARLDSGAPYIVMEHLDGSDLAALLAESGALHGADAVNYLLQACDGLSEAHGLGIVHRDLKPENLFLAHTPEGVVLKILDFGISKNVGTSVRSARSTLTKRGATVGSPFYMSPEQMRASPSLDARADVWSLGAILFELLTGHCPFEADTPAALCSKVMVDPAPALRDFLADAPEELDSIIQRCLQKEPELRFQSAAELGSALRECHAMRGPAAAQPIAEEAASAKRRPLLTAFALLAVSAFLVVAGAAFWRLQGRTEWARWSGTDAVSAENAKKSALGTALPRDAVTRSEPHTVPVSVAAASPLPPAPSSALPARTATQEHALPSMAPEVEALAPAPSPAPHDVPLAVYPALSPRNDTALPKDDAPAPPRDRVDTRYDL